MMLVQISSIPSGLGLRGEEFFTYPTSQRFVTSHRSKGVQIVANVQFQDRSFIGLSKWRDGQERRDEGEH